MTRRALATAVLLLSPVAAAADDAVSLLLTGPEIVVSEDPGWVGWNAELDAVDGVGAVVAWLAEPVTRGGAAGADDRSVRARRLDVNGEPIGAELRVDEREPLGLGDPVVALAADGSFVVVWNRDPFDAVAARLVSASGEPVGAELDLAETADSTAAAATPQGSFVVAWTSSSGYAFPFETYEAGAVGIGADASLSPTSRIDSGSLYAGRSEIGLATRPGGGVLAVWEESYHLLARPLDASGAPTAPLARFAEPFTDPDGPAITVGPDDVPMAVWSALYDGADGARVGIFSRRLDADGAPDVNQPMHVASDELIYGNVQLCALPSGGYLVLWPWQITFGPRGYRMRALDAAGRPASRILEIPERQDLGFPAAACGDSPVVAYPSDGRIAARRIAVLHALFADDFESGDTTRWDPPER